MFAIGYPRKYIAWCDSLLHRNRPARNALAGENRIMTSVRIDKWLWAARFFKTRTLAARACELGRIQSNGQPAKAAREVRIGDMLRITNEGGEFHVAVLLLSDVRGPASIAQTLYQETEASRELRQKVAAERKAMKQFEELPAGRPSKRDRRRIIQFRGRA
jgi:ribosome-associated heat shock protein Hsp15